MRHTLIAAALAAALTAISGCNNGPGPVGQGNYGTVFGTITASAGGKPIAAANVIISGIMKFTTDANGVYRATTVPLDSPGIDESVAVSATGYQPQTKMVHVAAAGQQYEVDFQLVASH
jgi:Carboxypeptidase regulatory-like domain